MTDDIGGSTTDYVASADGDQRHRVCAYCTLHGYFLFTFADRKQEGIEATPWNRA